MPTGYTAALAKMNFDVPRWLSEEVIRNFGLMVMLRDERMGLTRDELRAKLQAEEDHSYYRDREASFAKELAEAKTLTAADWEKKMEDAATEIKADNEKAAVKWIDEKSKHQKALNEIIALKAMTTTEFEKGVLAFAEEQLTEGIRFDYNGGPYQSPVPTDAVAFARDEIRRLGECLAQAKKSYHEERLRTGQRIAMYQQWLDFIDRAAPMLASS